MIQQRLHWAGTEIKGRLSHGKGLLELETNNGSVLLKRL